jgi:hypothetical protein
MKRSRAPLFSPRGLLLRAGVLAALFLACHLAGWREHTSILCGTAFTANVTDRYSQWFGMVYVVLYLGSVIVVPILILAAGLITLINRVWRAKSASTD